MKKGLLNGVALALDQAEWLPGEDFRASGSF